MENIYQRSLPTDLELNGPTLSFTTQPVGIGSTVTGSVTLTGIATVSWATTTPSSFGTISYQWYESDGTALSDDANISGSGTTIVTISNLRSPQDNGRQFYLEADYNATDEYDNVKLGTGNAFNEPKKSDTVGITVEPLIEIISQPTTSEVIANQNATFTIDAGLTDTSYGDVSYQWLLNGNVVSDGTITDTIGSTALVEGNQSFTYTSDTALELIDARNITIVVAGGAGGQGVSGPGVNGGNGRAGRLPYAPGQTNVNRTLKFQIGRAGNSGSGGDGGKGGASSYAAGGDGAPGTHGGGGGGGATAVYDETLNRYTIVSAGGGGGGGSGTSGPPNDRHGGLGFGRVRDAMSNDTSSPDPGGNGSNKGGGGGGGAQPTNYPAAGAGGNGADGNGGASGFDTRTAAFAYDGWGIQGNGYASITYTGKTAVDTTVTRNTIISGSTTKTLSLTSDQVGIQTVACSVSSNVATNSPLISNTENFVVRSTAEEYLVNIEGINNTDTANLTRVDLFNGEYEFTTSTGDPTQNAFIREYSFYSPDKDLNVEMDLYGAKGADFGSRSGGEGGFSRIRFTMAKNVEYVLAGLIEVVNAPFLYRKATLIACVGEGGDAGFESAGGFGGGINVAGENGSGVDGGNGGDLVAAGTLPSNGYYGTLTSLTPVNPDTTSNEPQGGGRTIPCARGVYWRDQGKAPCDDLGTIKFRNSDGTEVTNTAEISRGYKSGYNIIQTKGLGETFANAGDGGTGAMGGKGGRKGYGGGGGSGYTDDSVTVVSTQQGGSEFTTAKVVLRIVTRTIQKVTFTQSRTTNENGGFDMTLQSGNGPQTITFGSKSGFSGTLPSTVTADIEEGSIYTITRTNNVDTRTLSADGTLNMSDTDSNPGSLSVKPDKGRWTDTNTYEFTT
tara:strand:- start:53 stop:2746 length:2694 start_codon:yes stop_codon:yes gene_type:complete